MRVVRGEENREIPLKTILQVFRAMPHRVVGPYVYQPHLLVLMVYPRQEAIVATPIDNLRVKRIDSQVGALTSSRGLPVALGNAAAAGAAVQDAYRRVILLGTQDAIGEVIVGGNTVKLGGRLVVVGSPVFTSVKAYLGATVICDDHALVVFRGYPQVMVVAMRCTKGFESLAPVFGAVVAYIHHIHYIFILRIGINARVIPGALPQLTLAVGLFPGFSPVIGAEYTSVFIFQDNPYPL